MTARAMADLSQGAIVATVEIEAAPERVFRAISTAEVADWWGSPDLYRITRWTADLRPGGAWRSEGVGAGGKGFGVSGKVLEVDPPRLLVQTWNYDWGSGGSTIVRYQIDPIPAGSLLTIRHTGFAPDSADCSSHEAGWIRVLGWLEKHLLAATASPR
jgi:uncharacterized protein YndB with AHSA1/START domain